MFENAFNKNLSTHPMLNFQSLNNTSFTLDLWQQEKKTDNITSNQM